MELFIIFMSQLLFQLSRSLGARFEAHNHRWKATLFAGIIQSFWLISTYLGVRAMIDSDWVTICGYLVGGMLGVFLNFYVKVPSTK